MEPKIAQVSEGVLKTLAEGDIKIAHLLARIEKDEVYMFVSFQVTVLLSVVPVFVCWSQSNFKVLTFCGT